MMLQWLKWWVPGLSIIFQIEPYSTRNFQWYFHLLCVFALELLTFTSLPFHLQQVLQFYLNLEKSMTELWKRYVEPGVRFINLLKSQTLHGLLGCTSAYLLLCLPHPFVFLRICNWNTHTTKNEEMKASTAFLIFVTKKPFSICKRLAKRQICSDTFFFLLSFTNPLSYLGWV